MEAKDLFEKAIESNNLSANQSYKRFTVDVGRINVQWNKFYSVRNERSASDHLEVRFNSNKSRTFYKYLSPRRGVYLDADQRLLFVRDSLMRQDVFIMTVLADYSKKKKGEVSMYIHNDGNYLDYTGLIVYSKLSGEVVRVNRYVDGKYIDGATTLYSLNKTHFVNNYRKMQRLIGPIFVLERKLLIKTKSCDDDSTSNWTGDFDYVLDSSVCIADADSNYVDDPSYPGDNGDSDEYWRDCLGGGDSGGVDPGVGEGGGGGGSHTGNQGSTNTGNQAPDTEHVREIYDRIVAHIILDPNNTPNESNISILTETIMEMQNKNSDLYNSLLLNITILPTIQIHTRMSSPATSNTGHTIFLPVDQLTNMIAICEEFFHVYQKQMSGTWHNGDLELEAKIFDCLLFDKFGNNSMYDRNLYFGSDNVTKFMDFISNPCDATCSGAIDALRSISDGYYNEVLFPVTPSLDLPYYERLTHINNLL